MSAPYSYQVNLDWIKERKGILGSKVLNGQIEVATPPEFPKGMAGIWSPEHLFVASVNSCFMTTFLAIAENSKLDFEKFECDATGTLEKLDGKYMISKILLCPTLTIIDADEKEKAIRVLEMSEKACLITNSVKAEIKVQTEIKIAV